MSETTSGAAEWLLALDSLLVRLKQLHKGELDETVRRLCKAFRSGGCVAYQAWLTPGAAEAWLPPGAECPPTNPSPELETVALNAVIGALNRIPTYAPAFTPPDQFPGLTPDQLRKLNEGALTPDLRHELEELRLRAIRLARDRLNVLDSDKLPADAALFLDFPKLPRRLLSALLGKGKVPRDKVLKVVYPEKRNVIKGTFGKLVGRTSELLATNKELTKRGIRLEVVSQGEAVWLADISTGEPWTSTGQK